MDDSLNASIAEALEAPLELTPYMPELLEDLWALGTNPEMVVRLLAPRISENTRVLDLACGKGAVSVTLARMLGCHVLGLDAMAPFIGNAKDMAEKQHVAHLCQFVPCDIREYRAEPNYFDVVILGAARPVLGSLKQSVGVLRTMVKPGGLMVLDDAYRDEAVFCRDLSVAECLTREAAHVAMTAHGDRIVIEEDVPLNILHAENERNNRFIQQRVAQLAEGHPAHAAWFCAYASRQLYECYLLENCYRCAVWVLEKKVG